VALFQRKYANAFPPSVDVLLKEKMLRKKFKDPITNGDFRFLSPLELQALPGVATTTTPGFPGRAGATPGPTPGPGPGGASGGTGTSSNFGSPGIQPGGIGQSALGPNGPTVGPQGGIAAVVSRSSAASIKVFKNRRQYNQWVVTVQDVMPRSAVGTPQPGQQPGLPGQSTTPFGGAGTSPGPTSGFPSRPNP
jgi:hypothetical protein